jgi:phospholipid/cholesterol/gamma-HCH transport system substrate-binding protein
VRIDNPPVFGQFSVTAQFVNSDAIFAGAEVTYRAFPSPCRECHVGGPRGGRSVAARRHGASDFVCQYTVVASSSAIGEQYIDLRPDSDEGSYLEDGAVVEQAQATLATRSRISSRTWMS